MRRFDSLAPTRLARRATQISAISLDGGTVASYEYNPVGATTAKSLENGLSALYRYDAAHRLVGLEHRRGLDLLAKIDYTLDSVGNRTAKTQSLLNPLTENYAYDAVDQLIQAKYGTSRTVGYQYDAVGNRQGVTEKRGRSFKMTYFHKKTKGSVPRIIAFSCEEYPLRKKGVGHS